MADGSALRIQVPGARHKFVKRVRHVALWIALSPAVVLLSPYALILWIGMHDEGCRGEVGADIKVPAGAVFSAEVAADSLLPISH